MDCDLPPRQQGRQTFLAVFLTLLLGGGFLTFLIIINPLFLFLVPLLAGIFLFSYVHYLLWGKAFSRQVEDEFEREVTDPEA